MRVLLVVLCSFATLAAVFAGGCAVLFSGVAALAPDKEAALGLLSITVPVAAAALAVLAVNGALIAALSSGKAPRRSVVFVLLAIVDLAAAAFLATRIRWGDGFLDTAAVPAALLLKGVLTLLLPGTPPPPLATSDVDGGRPPEAA